MERGSRAGAIAVVVASLAGFAWTALELMQPALGFNDTDSPAVTLAFLATHADVWAKAALVLLLFGTTLVVSTSAVAEVLAPRSSPLAVKSISAAGFLAAACFFLFGVLRGVSGPLQYVEGLDRAWGEAAFLVVQVAGVHGFAQAGLLAFCLWAVGVSVVGFRSGALPRVVCLLGLIPGLRVAVLLFGSGGAIEGLPDVLWIVAMLVIPATFLWSLVLGLVLLRRSLRGPAVVPGGLA
jgi:hypothetical protein